MKDDCPKAYPSLWSAWKEIIASLFIITNNPEAYIERELPAKAHPSHVRHPAEIFKAITGANSEGWFEINTAPPKNEEVLRLDHLGHSYAIYRSLEGKLFATDGLCTHGNSHLSEGVVKGNLIECSKHNGRFDIRNGSCQRNPVNVPLNTHEVKEENERLYFKPSTQTSRDTTYRFKVVSNKNVATYIKELVLEPVSSKPLYQPGDYLQLDIPTYKPFSLNNIELPDSVKRDWDLEGVFQHFAQNKVHCRRNYSLASNPENDHFLKFNVRLATSPKGSEHQPGIGSSYVFSLKQGDEVITTSSYGDFHIKDSQNEMVYLGGGAGMAPMRSHISYLLESLNSERKISFWYGARSKKELFYVDYFKSLEEKYPNFEFQIALSDPKPEDKWQGHTGFVHSIFENVYLMNHPKPNNIEYYLCGPPAMIEASTTMLKKHEVPEKQISFDAF
jgi:Na(+)-translocating NADH:ubiquinone oxidoreductase F subunit